MAQEIAKHQVFGRGLENQVFPAPTLLAQIRPSAHFHSHIVSHFGVACFNQEQKCQLSWESGIQHLQSCKAGDYLRLNPMVAIQGMFLKLPFSLPTLTDSSFDWTFILSAGISLEVIGHPSNLFPPQACETPTLVNTGAKTRHDKRCACHMPSKTWDSCFPSSLSLFI